MIINKLKQEPSRNKIWWSAITSGSWGWNCYKKASCLP